MPVAPDLLGTSSRRAIVLIRVVAEAKLTSCATVRVDLGVDAT
jgi:hypothetical protein